LRKAQLINAKINASKSLLGHGLTAAGLTETVVTVLQMQQSFMHANPNLLNPVCHELNWVGQEVEERPFDKAITLSMGFGGVNSALALAKL
jgi:malonyl-ACP decarboxylase